MTKSNWTIDEDQLLSYWINKGLTQKNIASILNKSEDQVFRRARAIGLTHKTKVAPKTIEDPSTETKVVDVENDSIKSLEEALKAANVDLSVWEVDRQTVNKWDMMSSFKSEDVSVTSPKPMWQVKVTLKRRKSTNPESIVDRLIEKMDKHSPVYKPLEVKQTNGEKHLLEVSAPDVHIGKFAWKPETGNDYDLKIAIADYKNVIEQLLERIKGFNIDQIVFPLGNDLVHIDNDRNETTAGTRQDVDSRFGKVYLEAMDLMIWAIERLRLIAPVVVKVVPGNHDNKSAFCIGHAIKCWFRNCGNVEVDNEPFPRKYHRYGTNLLAWSHGDKGKNQNYPMLMAQERKQDWADTTHREIHLGHYHKKKEEKYTAGDTHLGVIVRTISAMSATDSWHADNHYMHSMRAAECYLYSFDKGYVGHFSASPPMQKE